MNVRLTWTGSEEVDVIGYNVYVEGVRHNPVVITESEYIVPFVEGQRIYVTAVDEAGNESNPSRVIIPYINTEYNLQFEIDTENWIVSFSWDHLGEWVEGYNIFIDGVQHNATTLTDPFYSYQGQENEEIEMFVVAIANGTQIGTPSETLTVVLQDIMAEGGEVYEVDGYRYHRFKEDGILTVHVPIMADILVVGGGGGGGSATNFSSAGAGGGGAGGVVTSSRILESGETPIVVGEGGGSTSGNSSGYNGEDSIFEDLIALGGGGGGGGNVQGNSGGSGGGSRNNSGGIATQPNSISGGFGNNGGNFPNSSTGDGASGGGGAGSEGVSGGTVGTDGGQGIQWLDDNYYAGGGGGGMSSTGVFGKGFHGGGDGGNNSSQPTSGQDGTGGGGGGGNNSNVGAKGGSGVVIVRYPYNVPPISSTPIPDHQIEGMITIDLSDYFTHSSQLTYEVEVQDPSVVSYDIDGSMLTLYGNSLDTTSITITASIANRSAVETFNVEVTEVYVGDTPNISSMYFDGSNKIDIGDIPQLSTNKLSIMSFFRLDNSPVQQPNFRTIISKGTHKSQDFGIYVNNTDNQIVTILNEEEFRENIPFNYSQNIDRWNHIGVVYNGNEVHFYLNFELVQSFPFSEPIRLLSSNEVVIGGEQTDSDNRRFAGNIDEVQIYNRALSREDMADLGNRILTGNELGLIGYWNFEDRDSNQVTDLSPNQNHGTLVGNPTYEYNAFDFNYALEFDGNSYVDLNKPIFSDNTSDPFTISTILKLNDTSPHWILTQRTGSVSGPKVSFETFSSNLRFFLEDASGNRIHTQTSIPVLSEYFLVTITYDGSKEVSGVKMYINSVEVVPNIVTSDVLGDTFGISDLNTGIGSVIESNHAYSMRGSINEMQIWNKVLTQREIQLNMNKELTGHEEGLVGYWKFDDLSDPTVVIDSSPNQNHGTIHG